MSGGQGTLDTGAVCGEGEGAQDEAELRGCLDTERARGGGEEPLCTRWEGVAR